MSAQPAAAARCGCRCCTLCCFAPQQAHFVHQRYQQAAAPQQQRLELRQRQRALLHRDACRRSRLQRRQGERVALNSRQQDTAAASAGAVGSRHASINRQAAAANQEQLVHPLAVVTHVLRVKPLPAVGLQGERAEPLRGQEVWRAGEGFW